MNKKTVDKVMAFSEWLVAIRSYIIMAICLLLSYFAKFYVIYLIKLIVGKLQVCSHIAFAIGVCISVAVLSSYLFWKILEGKCYVAHRTIAIATYLVCVYVYFRFLDHTFTFWGWSPYFAWLDLFSIPYVLLWVEKLTFHRQATETNYDFKIVTDTPIRDFSDDVFGHRKIIKTMIDNFNSLDLSHGSYSVGIVGEWGQGKTSFLNLFCKMVDEMSIVVRFNPRSAKSVDKIQDEFFCSFSDELKKYHTGVKRYVREYAVAVEAADDGWIGKLANIVASLTPDEQKERINAAIEKIGKRVYVIVEDLDRLTGQEIIEVLKLIDGNADFHNTIFMTAYDKIYVNEILKNYLVPSIAQDYTDKYFNLEYTLPTPSTYALKTYFRQYLNANINQVDDDLLTQKQMLDIWNECSDFVVRKLRTMRHIKRYINLFMTRYPKVKNDVDMRDYIYVTLLRYTDIRTYSALCEGRLLVRGSFLNGSDKILYQSEQAKDVLKTIGAKDSSIGILNTLFPEKGSEGTLEETYNRARWADNVNRYFYDYEIAAITHAKGIALFNASDDKKAFDLVDEYLNQGYSQSLSNFLRSRSPEQIGSTNGLCRLVKLITYHDKRDRTAELDGYMMQLMYLDEFNDYSKAGVIKDKSIFKNAVDTAMTFMLDYAPLEIGFACIRMIDGLLKNQLQTDRSLFTFEELVAKAEWAQKYYFQKWGTNEFQLESSLHLSAIQVNENNGADAYSYPARVELLSMMKSHPSEFAQGIVRHSVFNQNVKMLSLSFIQAFNKNAIFPTDGETMTDWINGYITDEKIKYVLHAIDKSETGYIQVKALKQDYDLGDFNSYYGAIKFADEEKLDKDIEAYMKSTIGVDLTALAIETDKTTLEVRESLSRLIQRDAVSAWYGKLKEKMDNFEVGDFVRLRKDIYNQEKAKLYYDTNVFRISKIIHSDSSSPLYKLQDLDKEFNKTQIEAIPIDGIHDRDLYYDPVIMASYVAPGQPIPVHHTDYSYFMESFTRTKYEDKNFVQIVNEANCQFVHEVQHYLEKKFHENDLKINKRIIANN